MSNKQVSTTVRILLPAIVLLSLLVLVLPNLSAKAENKDVSAPSGLEYCTSLTSLDLCGNLTGNMSSLYGISGLSGLGSLNQTGDTSPLSGLPDPSELYSMLDQIVNTASGSGLGDLSELYPLIDLIVNSASASGLDSSSLDSMPDQILNTASFSGRNDLRGQSGLNLSQKQVSDISPISTPAPSDRKDIWSIIGPIAIVAVISILVDGFLTLRGKR